MSESNFNWPVGGNICAFVGVENVAFCFFFVCANVSVNVLGLSTVPQRVCVPFLCDIVECGRN